MEGREKEVKNKGRKRRRYISFSNNLVRREGKNRWSRRRFGRRSVVVVVVGGGGWCGGRGVKTAASGRFGQRSSVAAVAGRLG